MLRCELEERKRGSRARRRLRKRRRGGVSSSCHSFSAPTTADSIQLFRYQLVAPFKLTPRLWWMLSRFSRTSTRSSTAYRHRSSYQSIPYTRNCFLAVSYHRQHLSAATLPPSLPPRQVMPDRMQLTFLGTAAGRPCSTRNVSSLALKVDKQM